MKNWFWQLSKFFKVFVQVFLNLVSFLKFMMPGPIKRHFVVLKLLTCFFNLKKYSSELHQIKNKVFKSDYFKTEFSHCFPIWGWCFAIENKWNKIPTFLKYDQKLKFVIFCLKCYSCGNYWWSLFNFTFLFVIAKHTCNNFSSDGCSFEAILPWDELARW